MKNWNTYIIDCVFENDFKRLAEFKDFILTFTDHTCETFFIGGLLTRRQRLLFSLICLAKKFIFLHNVFFKGSKVALYLGEVLLTIQVIFTRNINKFDLILFFLQTSSDIAARISCCWFGLIIPFELVSRLIILSFNMLLKLFDIIS